MYSGSGYALAFTACAPSNTKRCTHAHTGLKGPSKEEPLSLRPLGLVYSLWGIITYIS